MVKNQEKFFEVASEMCKKYDEIIDLFDDKRHLKDLAKSCLLFTSFVAQVYKRTDQQN